MSGVNSTLAHNAWEPHRCPLEVTELCSKRCDDCSDGFGGRLLGCRCTQPVAKRLPSVVQQHGLHPAASDVDSEGPNSFRLRLRSRSFAPRLGTRHGLCVRLGRRSDSQEPWPLLHRVGLFRFRHRFVVNSLRKMDN